jgi:hypothetical protein
MNCYKCEDIGLIDIYCIRKGNLFVDTYACDCEAGQKINSIKKWDEYDENKYELERPFMFYSRKFGVDYKTAEDIRRENEIERKAYLEKKFEGRIPVYDNIISVKLLKGVMGQEGKYKTRREEMYKKYKQAQAPVK